MDDTNHNDALIETYGNPEGTPERPLVTFALFAYNQEKYIREAVEGAFAQTYSPLEIILSDDCSSDRTFEIMQEMAKGYEGRHSIQIRRNEVNRGVVNHLASIVLAARSEYIIVAAGDDISKPERTEVLSQLMVSGAFDAVSSNVDLINECGVVQERNTYLKYNYVEKYVLASSSEILVPPAAAYTKSLISGALQSTRTARKKYKLQNEDFLLWLYLLGTGRQLARYSDRALVQYRKISTSLSAIDSKSRSFQEHKAWLKKESRMAQMNFEKQCAALEMAESLGAENYFIDKEVVRLGLERAREKMMMSSTSITDRIKALRRCRNFSDLRYGIVRMPGLHIAALIRWLAKSMRDTT